MVRAERGQVALNAEVRRISIRLEKRNPLTHKGFPALFWYPDFPNRRINLSRRFGKSDTKASRLKTPRF
jgi:hypothetical protein